MPTSPPAAPRRALLLGAYGQSNLGDDLLLEAFLDLLAEVGVTEVDVNVAEPDAVPAALLAGRPGVRLFSTYRTPPWRMLGLLRRADLVCYGGGTVFKELNASTGRSRYAVLLGVAAWNTVASALRTPVHGWGIASGTLRTRFGRALTRWALSRATHTAFRDRESVEQALAIGVRPDKVSLGVDGLFSLPRPVPPTSPADDRDRRTVIGLNALSDVADDVDRERYLGELARFLGGLDPARHEVLLLPFQTGVNPSNDLTFLREQVAAGLPDGLVTIAEQLDLHSIGEQLGRCDVLVGMRFHSLLLATAHGVPFVGLSYDPKCRRYLDAIDHPHRVELTDLDADGLRAAVDAVLDTAAVERARLAGVAEREFTAGRQWREQVRHRLAVPEPVPA